MIKDHIVTGVPAHAVDKVWEEAEPLIDLTDMKGRATLDQLHDMTLAGDMQLWIVEPLGKGGMIAAALTEVALYPSMRAVRVLILGGRDMAAWFPLFNDEMNRFARLVGATVVEANVREGLARRLRADVFGAWQRINTTVQHSVPVETEKQQAEV